MIEIPRYLSEVNWFHVIFAAALFTPVMTFPHFIYVRFILSHRRKKLRPLAFIFSEKNVRRMLGPILNGLYVGFLIGGLRSNDLEMLFDKVAAQPSVFGDEVAYAYALFLVGNANYLFTTLLIAVRFGKDPWLFLMLLPLGLLAMFVSVNLVWEVIPFADDTPFGIKMAITSILGAAAIVTLLQVMDLVIAPREVKASEAGTKWRPAIVIAFALCLVAIPGVILKFLGVGQSAAYVVYLIISLPVLLVVTFALFDSESLAGRLFRTALGTRPAQAAKLHGNRSSEPPQQ